MLETILLMMTALVPAADHSELGGAIARVVEAEAPLFAHDESKHRTAAYLVAIAYRESTLRLDAVGDKGRSFCAFQIHASSGGTKALLEDADACVRKAFAMLRASARLCPAAPLAWYAAGGTAACSNARAIRISNDRVALARRLLTKVAP